MGDHRPPAGAGAGAHRRAGALEALAQTLVDGDPVAAQQQDPAQPRWRLGLGAQRLQRLQGLEAEDEAPGLEPALRQAGVEIGAALARVPGLQSRERLRLADEATTEGRRGPERHLVDRSSRRERLEPEQAAEAKAEADQGRVPARILEPLRGGLDRADPGLDQAGVGGRAAAVAGRRQRQSQRRVALLGQQPSPAAASAIGGDLVPTPGWTDEDAGARRGTRLGRMEEGEALLAGGLEVDRLDWRHVRTRPAARSAP